MMSKKQIAGLSTFTMLLLGAGAALYAVQVDAASTPVQTTATTDGFTDPAPQRLQLAQAQPATGGGSVLPGGASSLNETYRDWRVTCVQQGTAKRCALSQAQAQQNGQRVLAMELSAPTANTVSGTLVLPFGLALDSGVAFQIDDKPAMAPIRFRTCLPGRVPGQCHLQRRDAGNVAGGRGAQGQGNGRRRRGGAVLDLAPGLRHSPRPRGRAGALRSVERLQRGQTPTPWLPRPPCFGGHRGSQSFAPFE